MKTNMRSSDVFAADRELPARGDAAVRQDATVDPARTRHSEKKGGDDDDSAFARFLKDSGQKKGEQADVDGDNAAGSVACAVVHALTAELAERCVALASSSQAKHSDGALTSLTSTLTTSSEMSKPRQLAEAVLREIEGERDDESDESDGFDRSGVDAASLDAAFAVGHEAKHVVHDVKACVDNNAVSDPTAALETALQLLDDPAARASLDQRNAVVVVDDLRLRVTTRDGAAAVVVEGRKSAAVLDQSAELSRSLAAHGLAMTRLTAAGAAADSQNQRHGKAVVDVDDDAGGQRANADDNFADFFVTA